MFSKIFSRLVFIFLLLTTITPLIYQKKLLFPFDSEKGLFFRFIVEIMLGLWLILILKEPIFRPKKTPINLSLGFLCIVLIIVDLLGVDVPLSIFSNFERMAGLIQYLSLFAYCLIISSIVNTQKRWLIFGISISTIAFIVAIKGIMQSYDSEEMLLNGNRVVGTVGNPNQLAMYLLSGFFVVGLLISQWILQLRKTKPFLPYLLLFISFIFLLTYLFCSLKTSTRGSLVGLVAGICIMLVLTFFYIKKQKIRISIGGFLMILLIGISAVFYFRKSSIIDKNVFLKRITRVTDSDGYNTFQSRIENYKVAIEGIKAKPFLGWGQETFHYTYAQYFNPKLYADATWYDRTHNIILEWLIIGGILGLLAYLSLWGAVLYQLWRKESQLNTSMKIIISGFLGAYFVSNLSLFDNLLTLMAFMIILAFVQQHEAGKIEIGNFKVDNKSLIFSSFVITIITFFTVKITCLNAYQTNKSIANAFNAGSLEEVIAIYEKGYENALIGRQEVAEQLILMSSDVVNSPLLPDAKAQYFATARKVMQTEINHHPEYARLQILYGNLLEKQGDNAEAIKVFEKVQKLAPKRQNSLRQLAMLYAKNQQFDKAINLLKYAISLEKSHDELKTYQAIVWAMKGNKAERDRLINEVSEKELNKNVLLVKQSFELTDDLDSFLKLCNEHFLGKEHTQLNAYQTWATTAYNQKNTKEAATATFAFRLHYTDKSNFIDQRDALQIRQDVLNGKNPAFAFQSIAE
jgi:O-antigen ligase/tetratricopeptide (TPR) repeat protein